jgi:hypothetical protein
MKHLIRITLIFILPSLLFTVCKKYEEGPLVSLRGKAKRIEGLYMVERLLIDGVDCTSLYNNINYSRRVGKIYIYKNDKGELEIRGYTHHPVSKYVFGDFMPDEKLKIIEVGGDKIYAPFLGSRWKITRLTKKELWYTSEVNSKQFEVHLNEK